MAKPLPLRTYLALYTGSERRAIQRLRRLEAAGTISPEEYQNRLARDLPPRPEGELLWCHVATDDAAEAASDMCRGLMEDRPDLSCLFTTSRQVTALKPPENSIVLPVPEENDAIARRFVAHFAPTVLCWIGGDFRPALLWHSRKTGVKCLAIDVTTRAPDFEASLSLPGLRTVNAPVLSPRVGWIAIASRKLGQRLSRTRAGRYYRIS